VTAVERQLRPHIRDAAANLTLEAGELRAFGTYGFHAARHAFENDVAPRRRSNHVAYTDGDGFERPAATIADLTPRLVRPL
jgi:hypothetical protein